jgi:hypothetical protein
MREQHVDGGNEANDPARTHDGVKPRREKSKHVCEVIEVK